MDWNISMHSPWDWGISSSFGEESSEISKLVSSMDWANDEAAGFVGNPSMYLFPSDHPNMVCISSPNSLISASIDSSSKETTNMSNFEAPESFNRDPTKREESMCVEDTGTSITLFSSVGAKEPPTDLMLGKRTYFVDTPSRNTKIGGDALLADDSSQITASGKIHKTSQPSAPTNCCQVEGCNADLFAAKDYHRKHKVCESHSKCPKVRVAGHDCRFCQQCSRFHNLSEFDEKKRSCRKRLSVHNARRRKTQPDAILFNSTGLSSSFYVAAGLGRSVPISNGNISQDQRALYLLSNNSGNAQSSPVNWFMPAHHHTNMAQQPMTQQGFSSNNISAMWHHLQHSKEESHAPPLVLYRNNQFQELQLLNSPYHPDHFCCSHANR